SVLQRLETRNRDTELDSVLGVLDSLLLERAYDAEGLGAHGKHGVVDRVEKRGGAVIDRPKYGVTGHPHVFENYLRGTMAINSLVRAANYAGGTRFEGEQGDSSLVTLLLAGSCGNDQEVGDPSVQHDGFAPVDDVPVVRRARSRSDIARVESSLRFRHGERGLDIAGNQRCYPAFPLLCIRGALQDPTGQQNGGYERLHDQPATES